MRVRLKGINTVRKCLADGRVVTYYYAWKGGPRLEGRPGSPEYIASFNAAVATLKPQKTDILDSVIRAFERSPEFINLADHTKKDYRKRIAVVQDEFGDFPTSALSDTRARGIFLNWRDRHAQKSRRNADYLMAVLARILSWGLDRGLVPKNPCERPGRVYRAARNGNVWAETDEQAFYAKAPRHLHLALTLAIWTGQRQGDLLRLTWGAYDGTHIRFTQGKTKKRLVIRAGEPLRLALDAVKQGREDDAPILTTEAGKSWTESGFRASWRKACARAGVVGVTFHDLRGTAVTRLAVAGCETPEIAAITGHSLRDVGTILDAHYLNHADSRLGESAIAKLEAKTKLPTAFPTA